MSSSGVRSTRTTSAASCRTRSGTVSRTATPVMRETTSARLSRCWMLSAVQTLMPASSNSWTSCQRFGMPAVGSVGVGELVDDDQLGLARERRVEIEFLERAAVIFDPAPRQDFEPFDERARLGAAMRLDEPDRRHRRLRLSGAARSAAWRRSCRRRARRRGRPSAGPRLPGRNAARSASGSGRAASGRLVGAIGARRSS